MKGIKMQNETYANGQKKVELVDHYMTHYFNDGTVKAEGPYEKNQMQGEWKFYRKTGQLWQVGNFKNDMKHGSWVRYDKEDELEYSETFKDNKIVKK